MRNLRHVGLVRSVCRTFSLAAVAFVALLGVGVGLPAYANGVDVVGVAHPAFVQAVEVTAPRAQPPQTLAVSAQVPAAAVVRDAYSVTVPPRLVWPVPVGSPIGSPFGARSAPCSGCSSMHEGVDFDAGWGTPIHAIAAGVVVQTTASSPNGLGVHVGIEHVIDGQVVVSVYGHMQVGSMPLNLGDIVYAGEVVGLLGNTGESTGAHLHFEIRPGGTAAVNPLAWMHARLG